MTLTRRTVPTYRLARLAALPFGPDLFAFNPYWQAAALLCEPPAEVVARADAAAPLSLTEFTVRCFPAGVRPSEFFRRVMRSTETKVTLV